MAAILVDSTFYIAQQRAGRDPRQILGPWLMGGLLWSCGVIRAEVLRGVVKPRIKEDWSEFFALLPEIPTDRQAWEEASDLAWRLDREGLILPLTDIVIGCCALREDAVVISHDRHFLKIPGLKVREDLPITGS